MTEPYDDTIPFPQELLDLDEFQDVIARLRRARHHYREFGNAWSDYLDTKPHAIRTEVDDAGHGTVRLIRYQPIPTELSLIVGEFLYQLRAALDNCLYAVAAIDTGQNPPPYANRLQWPICEKPADWTNAKARLTGLSAHLVAALEAIQPYQAHCPAWNCLKILNHRARVDRHRETHLFGTYSAEGRYRYDKTAVSDIDVTQGIVRPGGILTTFRYHLAEPIGREHIDGDFVFDVDFDDVELSTGPGGGDPTRPWGPLDKRLWAVFLAVAEYTEGLTLLALHPDLAEDA